MILGHAHWQSVWHHYAQQLSNIILNKLYVEDYNQNRIIVFGPCTLTPLCPATEQNNQISYMMRIMIKTGLWFWAMQLHTTIPSNWAEPEPCLDSFIFYNESVTPQWSADEQESFFYACVTLLYDLHLWNLDFLVSHLPNNIALTRPGSFLRPNFFGGSQHLLNGLTSAANLSITIGFFRKPVSWNPLELALLPPNTPPCSIFSDSFFGGVGEPWLLLSGSSRDGGR